MTSHYPRRASIDSYGNGGFSFAGMSHRGSILALPSGIYGWDIDPARLTAEDFAPVLAERDDIEVLIIGMGTGPARPPAAVREALSRAGLAFDAMETGHALATYNILLEERRRVAAALVAVDLGA